MDGSDFKQQRCLICHGLLKEKRRGGLAFPEVFLFSFENFASDVVRTITVRLSFAQGDPNFSAKTEILPNFVESGDNFFKAHLVALTSKGRK